MNQPTDRDLFAEVDEIVKTMRTVLDAVNNMGEEVMQYRQAFRDINEQMPVITAALKDTYGQQTRLNVSFGDLMTQSVSVSTDLEKRIATLENEYVVPLANALAGFDERLSALENGHRLIVP